MPSRQLYKPLLQKSFGKILINLFPNHKGVDSMIEIIVYMVRCLIMLLATWTAIRIVGKKTIAQMTSYELAGILLLTTAAAEPLVFKVPSKATVGAFTVALGTIAIGWLSLKKGFYNIDSKPGIVVVNGEIDKKVLKDNKMNLPFLLS